MQRRISSTSAYKQSTRDMIAQVFFVFIATLTHKICEVTKLLFIGMSNEPRWIFNIHRTSKIIFVHDQSPVALFNIMIILKKLFSCNQNRI